MNCSHTQFEATALKKPISLSRATKEEQSIQPPVSQTGPMNSLAAGHQDEVLTVDASETWAELRMLLDVTPDLRRQKIEILRQAIHAGAYRVSNRNIADAMLRKDAASSNYLLSRILSRKRG